MTKECPVIMNNAAVTVVKFGDTKVQFPAIGDGVKTVKVKFVKGRYILAEKSEPEEVDIKVESTEAESETEQAEEMKAIMEEE